MQNFTKANTRELRKYFDNTDWPSFEAAKEVEVG